MPYIDGNRQLNADPSIRYYHFDEVQGSPWPTFRTPRCRRFELMPGHTERDFETAIEAGLTSSGGYREAQPERL